MIHLKQNSRSSSNVCLRLLHFFLSTECNKNLATIQHHRPRFAPSVLPSLGRMKRILKSIYFPRERNLLRNSTYYQFVGVMAPQSKSLKSQHPSNIEETGAVSKGQY